MFFPTCRADPPSALCVRQSPEKEARALVVRDQGLLPRRSGFTLGVPGAVYVSGRDRGADRDSDGGRRTRGWRTERSRPSFGGTPDGSDRSILTGTFRMRSHTWEGVLHVVVPGTRDGAGVVTPSHSNVPSGTGRSLWSRPSPGAFPGPTPATTRARNEETGSEDTSRRTHRHTDVPATTPPGLLLVDDTTREVQGSRGGVGWRAKDGGSRTK